MRDCERTRAKRVALASNGARLQAGGPDTPVVHRARMEEMADLQSLVSPLNVSGRSLGRTPVTRGGGAGKASRAVEDLAEVSVGWATAGRAYPALMRPLLSASNLQVRSLRGRSGEGDGGPGCRWVAQGRGDLV